MFVETEARPIRARPQGGEITGRRVAAHDVFLAVAPAGTGMLPGTTRSFTQPLVAGADPPAFPIVEGRPYDERRPDELVVNEAMRGTLDLEIGDRLVLVSLTRAVRGQRRRGPAVSPASHPGSEGSWV